MTKKIGILMLILLTFTILLNSEEVAYSDVIIGTFSWQDQPRDIFLLPGIYHFKFSGTITTDSPFTEYNLWSYNAVIDGNYSYSQYDSASSPVVNCGVGDISSEVKIYESGYYSIKAGIQSIYGCIVNSNQATLIRTCLFSLK